MEGLTLNVIMCVTLIRRLCPLVNLCIPYLGVCSLIKMCLSGSLGEKRPIGKGRRKPLDVCWLNQHLLFFFLILQLNSVPLQTWFQRCRADGEGSDLRWAMWCMKRAQLKISCQAYSLCWVSGPPLSRLLFPFFTKS